MIYGRAYVSGGQVVALHTCDEVIKIVLIEGCDLYDLTLLGQTAYDQVSLVNGVVVGSNVMSCKHVSV
jgi:hypothetical protein